MKTTRIIIFSAIVVLLLPLIAVVIFNSTILRSNTPVALKSLVQLLWPPRDLFDPLAIEVLAFSAGKAEKVISYRNKYHGRHKVGLLFEKLDQSLYQRKHQLNLASSVTCYSGGDLVFSLESTTASPFLGKIGNGVSVLFYEVPNNLPLDEVIECEFSIEGVGKGFLDKYGPASLYVMKSSDL